MKSATFLAVLALATGLSPLAADEFHFFSGVYGYSGYAQTPPGPSTKVRVFPQLSLLAEPTTAKNNGDISVNYGIITKSPNPNLAKIVVQNVLNLPASAAAGYGVDMMRLEDVMVALEVNGEEVGVHKMGALTPTGFGLSKGQVYYKGGDPEIIEAIVAGDFTLRMSYTYPLSTFSGLYLSVDQKMFTSTRAKAFKEFVSKVKKEAGGILFWKYSSEVASISARESFESETSSSFASSTNIVMVDPTPETQKRLETLLGFVQSSQQSVVASHEAAADKAQNSGKPSLATLHSQYASAVNAKDVDAQINVLAAVASLSQGDILGFLANGMAFQKSSGSSSFNYYGTTTVSVDSSFQNDYNETIIKNARVAGAISDGPWVKTMKEYNENTLAKDYPGTVGMSEDSLKMFKAVLFQDAVKKNNHDLFWRLLVHNPELLDAPVQMPDGKWDCVLNYAQSRNRLAMVDILQAKGASGTIIWD